MESARVSAAMIARSHSVGDAQWSPTGTLLGWLDSYDSRTDLVIAPVDGSTPPVVVSADTAVSPSGAYGGGAWCFATHDLVVVAAADGRLLLLRTDGGGVVRVLSRDGDAAAPTVAPDGTRVAFSLDRDDSCDIAIVPLDGSAWPRRVSFGADYSWDPTWRADSRALAWHEWDLPNMSWDGSRIVATELAHGAAATVIAGGPNTAVGQPRYAPSGDALAFVSDASGWWNVHVADGRGKTRVLRREPHDHAEPAWGPGQRTFAWSPDAQSIAWCRNEAGFGRLVLAPVGTRAQPRELGKGWHHGLHWGANGILAARSGARTPQQIAVIEPEGGKRRIVARGPVAGFEAAGLGEPEVLEWKSGRISAHGLLWAPTGASANGGDRPPLYVHIHGGPTDQCTVTWNARAACWTSRGYAFFAPNYRGSSGYGRAYRDALNGRWGEVDVADVASGIRAVVRLGRCDPARVATIGGSAGGLTSLLLAARHSDIVTAAVSLFGVTDLFDLAATTHRFESRYLDRLVGELPRDADRYIRNSPITVAADITIPVLVLQGRDDMVVPIAQAEAMVGAMQRAGAPVEYHVFDGEGHGFRQIPNVIDEYERIEAFLHRALTREKPVSLDLEYEYTGPNRGADRAVLLAHGAGADMHAAALAATADALAGAAIPCLRFNYPYTTAGKKAPDRAPVLHSATRAAAEELARRTKLPPDRLVLGGRSMGGRYCSLLAGDADDPWLALGLALLGYPLHPPGKAERLRVEHFPRIRVPTLFVSGTRDAFGTPDELKLAAKKIRGPVSWHWIESADHGFKPLKSSGVTVDSALHDAAASVASFVQAL